MMKYITLLERRIENARVTVKYNFLSSTVTVCRWYRDIEKCRKQSRDYHKKHENDFEYKKRRNEYSKQYCKRPEIKLRQKESRKKARKNYRESHREKERMWSRKTSTKNQKDIDMLKINGCAICGYNKCTAALSFHHVNPQNKLYQISSRTVSKENIVDELNKCIVVCANCHMELHHSKEV